MHVCACVWCVCVCSLCVYLHLCMGGVPVCLSACMCMVCECMCVWGESLCVCMCICMMCAHVCACIWHCAYVVCVYGVYVCCYGVCACVCIYMVLCICVVCVYVCVIYIYLLRGHRVLFITLSFYYITVRWDHSLNMELDWQPASSRSPPDSVSHMVACTSTPLCYVSATDLKSDLQPSVACALTHGAILPASLWLWYFLGDFSVLKVCWERQSLAYTCYPLSQ